MVPYQESRHSWYTKAYVGFMHLWWATDPPSPPQKKGVFYNALKEYDFYYSLFAL